MTVMGNTGDALFAQWKEVFSSHCEVPARCGNEFLKFVLFSRGGHDAQETQIS